MEKPYHKQVLIRAYVNNAPETNEETLNRWLTELVHAIDMKIVIPARSTYVSAPGNAGLTGCINIETSHIAIHIWCEEKPNRIEMDVYSCKDFKVETVIEKLCEWDLVKLHYWLIDRNGNEFELVEKKTAISKR